MPACRPGPLAVVLLLGLLLLGLPRVPGGEAEKPGVCPQLQADLNCTQECLSDAQCADNLKCCQAGCATICHLPNGNPGRPGKGSVPGGQDTRFTDSSPAGWSLGKSGTGQRAGSQDLGRPALLESLPWGVLQLWEKQGSCPKVNTDFPQLGLCQDQCQVDSQCPGLLKCCYNGCGKVSCVTPVF
uniref:WAP four-disulfide core domain protein 2 n=1 Tax=Mustela putorius furo TaxID=9669 RepID=M3Z1Q5_MUSPF